MEILIFVTHILFVLALVAMAIIDLRTKQIHPGIFWGAFVIAVIHVFAEVVNRDMYWGYLWNVLATAAITFGIFYLAYRLTKGIGFGDVKLMGLIGFFYGLQGIFSIVFLSMTLVAVVGLFFMLKSKKNMKLEVPFAPFVAVAGIVRLVMGFL